MFFLRFSNFFAKPLPLFCYSGTAQTTNMNDIFMFHAVYHWPASNWIMAWSWTSIKYYCRVWITLTFLLGKGSCFFFNKLPVLLFSLALSDNYILLQIITMTAKVSEVCMQFMWRLLSFFSLVSVLHCLLSNFRGVLCSGCAQGFNFLSFPHIHTRFLFLFITGALCWLITLSVFKSLDICLSDPLLFTV